MSAYVSKKITEEGWRTGCMCRDEALHERDSGWSFMAGTEDEAYTSDPANISLLHVGDVCALDPAVMKHITAPAGTQLVRINETEFEEDNGTQEIFPGLRCG